MRNDNLLESAFWRPDRSSKILLIIWTIACLPSFIVGRNRIDGGYTFGRSLGSYLAPIFTEFIVASIVWLIFKRSNSLAQKTFFWILLLGLLSQLRMVLERVLLLLPA